MSIPSMRQYLQYIADRRLVSLGIQPIYGSKNPFDFMELQDVQELTNFFERRVSAYQTAVSGEVGFADDF
jgi:ribonucleoside-diphosphate reductase beta chain